MKALGENGWKVLTGKALTLRYPLIRRDISVPVDPKKRSLLQVSIPPAGLVHSIGCTATIERVKSLDCEGIDEKGTLAARLVRPSVSDKNVAVRSLDRLGHKSDRFSQAMPYTGPDMELGQQGRAD